MEVGSVLARAEGPTGSSPARQGGFSHTSRNRGPKDRHSCVAPSALPFSYAFFSRPHGCLRTAGPYGLGALRYVSVIGNSATKPGSAEPAIAFNNNRSSRENGNSLSFPLSAITRMLRRFGSDVSSFRYGNAKNTGYGFSRPLVKNQANRERGPDRGTRADRRARCLSARSDSGSSSFGGGLRLPFRGVHADDDEPHCQQYFRNRRQHYIGKEIFSDCRRNSMHKDVGQIT